MSRIGAAVLERQEHIFQETGSDEPEEAFRRALTPDDIRARLEYDSKTGDLHWIKSFGRWKAGRVAGGLRTDGYRVVTVAGQHILAHRLAWAIHFGEWPMRCIDHINGLKSDNRIENLRDVSHTLNLQNRSRATSTSKTGVLGVSIHQKTGRFVAQIVKAGKKRHLGLFKTAAEASAAYQAAVLNNHPDELFNTENTEQNHVHRNFDSRKFGQRQEYQPAQSGPSQDAADSVHQEAASF